MSASSFRCPHCATTLRVRDRKFIGRQIACPDCRQPIEIVADGPRGLGGKPVAVAEAPPRKTWRERAAGLWPGRRASTAAAAGSSAAVLGAPDGAGAAVPRGAPGRLARAAAVLASPVGVAWTLAGVVTLGMVVLIWPTDGATSRPGTGAAGGEAGTAHATPTQPQNDSRPGPAGNPAPVGVEDQIGDRLTRLGERLDAYRGAHGHFPAGTVPHPQFPPADRFSWLAELADDEGQPGRSRPLWDQRWHDPLNDRFVRQPMPDVLNPAVGEQVGRNRFPATHFAGMAGVGPDAPELPVTHPRAGIFGYDRQTRLEDIHDGTANTILVAGVQVRLGGWAGGGPGSVRSFTREPYVNGPDGFGTGQPDSMQVLMADGSVRTISKAVSPVIVRRMAAMADGFPLDDAVPGEPGDPPPVPRPTVEPVDDPDLAHAAPAPPRAARRADAPIDDPAPEEHADPPVAAPTPPEPAIDVAAALAQQIARYELPRPVAVRRLLVELEDMIGAPLDLGGGDTIELEARLDRTVSVRLEKTTVGAILDDVTRQAGISYTIDGGTIRLRPATAEPGPEGAAPAER